jgi:hypothetical protein
MEETREENVNFPNTSSQQCLFPISSYSTSSTEGHQKPALLFPCVGSKESEKSQDKDGKFLH